ncbi:MAG: transposase [bacterium]|nr:transposase [Gammaproteobacteria bacterium]
MTTPRSQLVDNEIALHYHLMSRCVRRSWLCGFDKPSRRKYDHRKSWLEQRLFHLAKCFAIEIDAFAILSNHFHLVVYYDPLACHQWDDAEVARRWTEAFPPKLSQHQDDAAQQEIRRENIMNDPLLLEKARLTLGSLSAFMKHLKQPIAWRANREDKCTGHFFESRFYSGALLSERAVLATMAYVDLNPVRAKICDTIDGYQHTSIYKRLQHLEKSPEQLQKLLEPLVSGLTGSSSTQLMSLSDYISHLRMLSLPPAANLTDDQAAWFRQVASIRKRQRAYGRLEELESWVERHGWKRTGDPLD